MSGDRDDPHVEKLLDTPDLADALGSDRFKQFLDHVPVGIAVAEITPTERVVYANPEFDRLTGVALAEIGGQGWEILGGAAADDGRSLSAAVTEGGDYVGAFRTERDGASIRLDAWSNLIEDDDGAAVFRLVALVARTPRNEEGDATSLVAAKDQQLRELQHRVKNNLQLITSLIRFEARGLPDEVGGERFDRLASRVGVLSLLYQSLTEAQAAETVDLGVYLSQVASAAMRAQASEGIRLDLQLDTWPVSVNVAMPTGLVVNELLTNALKHAFPGRGGGTIKLHGLVDPGGWRVVVADDGIGLPAGAQWPTPGTLPALFVKSLQQNANATVEVTSQPNAGVRVEILFSRAAAAPVHAA
jgi:two-component sensor histidine kinase